MSEVLVDVGVRYKQTYIPWRHRLEVDELLRKTHTVAIRTIAADAAPVAFRIHTISDDDCEDTGPSCSVRSFEGGVWWPLFDFNGPVSPREFTAAASQGTRRALTALGCTTDMEHPSALWEDDFEKKYLRCRLRETTFDSQRRLVEHGAAGVMFLDNEVLISAGPPVCFSVTDWNTEESHIMVGPSSFYPVPEHGYRLSGPTVHQRRCAAENGLVFRSNELEKLRTQACIQTDLLICSWIESLMPIDEGDAPGICSRFFADLLNKHAASEWHMDHPALRRHVLGLAAAGKPAAGLSQTNDRDLLEQFAAVDWSHVSPSIVPRANIARQILGRLGSEPNAVLTSEEDEAVSRM